MFTSIDHIGVAVESIDQSLKYYTEQLGMTLVHDENALSAGLRLTYLHGGNTMIQLIQPIGETSVRTFLAEKGEGLHHLCFSVKDIEQTLKNFPDSEDIKITMGGRGRRTCFLKQRHNGLLIELTELEPYSV